MTLITTKTMTWMMPMKGISRPWKTRKNKIEETDMRTTYKDYVIEVITVGTTVAGYVDDGVAAFFYIPKTNGLKSNMQEYIFYGKITRKDIIEKVKKIIDALG